MGNEIISSLQLKRPEVYRDIPTILAENHIISEDLAEKLSQMIGFRNILVHNYATVDLPLEYRFLQTRLDDFEDFIKQIADWLKKKKEEKTPQAGSSYLL